MSKVELSKDRKMRREVLRSKMFIKRYYLYLFLTMAIAIILGMMNADWYYAEQGEEKTPLIGLIICCIGFLPWAIFNLLFMLNVFGAVCKFKGKICFSFARFLFQASVAVIFFAGICITFFLSFLTFVDIVELCTASPLGFLTSVAVLTNPICYAILFLATTVVFYIYIPLEFIARKKGYVDLVQPVISRKKKSGVIGLFSGYIGMILLFWYQLYYSFILFFDSYTEIKNSVVISWYIAYLVFTTISFFVIRYLCQLRKNTILYFEAKINAAVLAFMLVIDLAVLLLYIGAYVEMSLIGMQFILTLNIIPAFTMLILFFRAKRMARYSSEEIEVVEEVEYITFEKTEVSAEWKMDEQSDPEQEKKSQTRMDTDF